MSDLINKMLTKILGVIVIILFIVGFKELILTNEDISFAFGELMGILPFIQIMGEIVSSILKCQITLPIPTTANVIKDLLRLALMACIQPIVVRRLTAIFLPLPNRNQILATSLREYERNETYMNSLGYKVKELLLSVAFVPLIAFLASWFTEWMFKYFSNTFGDVMAILLGSFSVLTLSVASIIPLLISGVGIVTAILWRLLVTLGAKMVTTFVTNMICLAVYVAIMGGIKHEIAVTIVTLIVWLIIMDFGISCLQKAIVS